MLQQRTVVSIFRRILSSMGWCRSGGVVCLSMRKILEKLKSLCSLSRLYVSSREGAGETASSTRDQGRALSTENVAGPRGISDSIGQDSLEDARSLGMSRADPAALPRLSSTETRRGRGQRARPLPAGSSSSSGSAVGQEMLGTPQLHFAPDELCRYNPHAF